MSCFNCYRKIKRADFSTRYRKPFQLTRKLQDKKLTEGELKPDISILDALEDILDGDVSVDRLKKHSAQYLCHECQIYLRRAINKKCELEHHIEILNEHVNQVTNEERRNYYKEFYGVDKSGRCWACMYKFIPSDYFKKKHAQRFNMKSLVVEEMTVGEAVNSLLEEQAETLIGLYWKWTYICHQCMNMLKNVIKSQCIYETLHTSFKIRTNPSSMLGRLTAGEEIFNATDSVESDVAENLSQSSADTDVTDQDEDATNMKPSLRKESLSSTKTKPVKCQGKIKITAAKLVSQASSGKRKHCEIDEVDDDAENESDDLSDCESNKMVINSSDGENNESLDDSSQNSGSGPSGLNDSTQDVGFGSGPSGSNKHSNDVNKQNKKSGKKSGVDDSNVSKANKQRQLTLTSDPKGGDEVKHQMQIKLSLSGKEIKELAVVEMGSKKIKLKAKDLTIARTVESRTMSNDQWKIYYYPKFAGRAEFIRLVFEEAGVPYIESTEDFVELRRLIIDGEMEGYPHFAPPVVTKGSLQISQTPVICRYLGEQFGLYPDTVEDKLHAEQINQCCHDYIAEGRLAFHGLAPVGSYASQKEGTQPYIDRFVSERLPRWLKYFERVLGANNQGKGFLYGDKICYADLALFHVIHATEAQFSDEYTKADYIPMIKAFKDRIASRKNIASYLKSDRWKKFCGDSMM